MPLSPAGGAVRSATPAARRLCAVFLVGSMVLVTSSSSTQRLAHTLTGPVRSVMLPHVDGAALAASLSRDIAGPPLRQWRLPPTLSAVPSPAFTVPSMGNLSSWALLSGASYLAAKLVLWRRHTFPSHPFPDVPPLQLLALAGRQGNINSGRSPPLSSHVFLLLLGQQPTRSKPEWTRVIEGLGGQVAGTLTHAVTHVVCGERAAAAKPFSMARERGLPLVTEGYLQHVRDHGVLPSAADISAYQYSVRQEKPVYHFCFAGRLSKTPHAAWAARLEGMGWGVSKTLTEKVTHVVIPDTGGGTKLHRQAVAKGIPVVTEAFLRQLVGDEKADKEEAHETQVAHEGEVEDGKAGQPAFSAEQPPALLLAKTWSEQDIAGWWMSEKMDGLRAYWNGQRLISRSGLPYPAPEWFVAPLPRRMALDGELWIGPNRFEETSSICRAADSGERWRAVRYMVFDAPELPLTYEARIEAIRRRLKRLPHTATHVELVAGVPCKDAAHVLAELDRVVGEGGEGLMLRQPGSLYERKRSGTLLKVKSFCDAEALVVGYKPGAGKHKNRVGSLEVELPNGVRFFLGTGLSDEDRNAPPPLRSVVTFRYFALSRDGVPRFPSFWRHRPDCPWPPPPDLGVDF